MTRLSRLSASPLSSRRPRPGAGMAGWRGAGPGLLRLSRIDRIRASAPTSISKLAAGQRTASPSSVANRRPASSPTTGIPASKTPKTAPTRSRVLASTPATPMPMAAARFPSPTATAARRSAITGKQ